MKNLVQPASKVDLSSRQLMLSVKQVTKEFPGVRALDAVSFNVFAGEVHGLIGENGAGKSTLMAVASGAMIPTTGEVAIDNVPNIGDPERARELGLSIVRQEPALMPDLSVAENIYLGLPEHLRPAPADIEPFAHEVLGAWNAELPFGPHDLVASLNPEHRFIVEIAKALAAKPKVLVLDEPTEHLAAADVERLFERIEEVTARGASVIYISHRIREVRKISSRVTVLRDGKGQGTYNMADLDEGRIVELIVGGTIDHQYPPKATDLADRETVLAVQGLSGTGFHDVSMSVRHGEIVGLAGIDANGQREFLRALAGNGYNSGTVLLRGKKVSISSRTQARSSRIGSLPGDRHREGILAELSVRENFSFRSIGRDATLGFVNQGAERQRAAEAVRAFAIKTPSIETPIRSLSGGNQQKLILSSVVATQPSILLIDEPTQGVDVGARAEIYRVLREIAENGTTIITVSSDAAELAGLCDRVMVFSRGQIVRELDGVGLMENHITEAVLTATTERRRSDRHIGGIWKWAGGHWAPLVIIAFALIATGAVATNFSPHYLSARNFSGMLALVATLALVAYGQQFILMIGEIDLSVGPLMGLCVVVGSFFLGDGVSAGGMVLGLLLMLGTALLIGLANFLLTTKLHLHAMVATLATFVAVQAVSLILRPVPGGLIGAEVYGLFGGKLGFIPVTLIAAVLIAAGLEFWLFRTTAGIALRGFGSLPDAARVAGISPNRTRLMAYLMCSLFAGIAAVPMLLQVGTGDPRSGLNYTLASIAAVVIGGGSLAGGRGSFIGALMGALLLNQINVVSTFLRLNDGWTFYLQGALIIAGVALYSKSRSFAASH